MTSGAPLPALTSFACAGGDRPSQPTSSPAALSSALKFFMNVMCALKSSGDHWLMPQSPVPFGAFIISMNFISQLLVARPDWRVHGESERAAHSRHPIRTFFGRRANISKCMGFVEDSHEVSEVGT